MAERTVDRVERMAKAFRKLRPFLRVQPGEYDPEWGFHPGHLAGDDEVRDYNHDHLRRVTGPWRYILWAPRRKELTHPTFEEFLEAYNAG